jgi:hypothetical protein
MDPRDRADALLARARARGHQIVTPDNMTSPMDSSETQQIPRTLVNAVDPRELDPDSTMVLSSRAAQGQPQPPAGQPSQPQPPQAPAPAPAPEPQMTAAPGVVPTMQQTTGSRPSLSERLSGDLQVPEPGGLSQRLSGDVSGA